MARAGVHRVGVATSTAGLIALSFGAFGTLAPFRVATGTPQGIFEALTTWQALIPLLLWMTCLALSLRLGRSSRAAYIRGWLAVALIASVVWLAGVAADRWIEAGDSVARYSIGGGAWISMFAAFALLMSSRREAGRGSGSRLVMLAVPVALALLVASGALESLGMAAEYRNVSSDFWGWVGLHLLLTAASLAVATVIATWLGVIAHGNRRIAEPLLTITSAFQTIPGLAMIGILAVPLGALTARLPALRQWGIGTLGWAPVVVALTLYALLVIARNTYAGLEAVPGAVVEAGLGMGLSRRQVLRRIEMPLAAPVLFSGVRTAMQQTIGNATLGVFVAAGTLGRPIFGGVSQTANDLTLLGSVTLVALALTTDISLRWAETFVLPRNLKAARR